MSQEPKQNVYGPFSIDQVCSSKHWNSVKAVIYGIPGIGKTSFAATFPNPILLRFEDGASALDIPTFPKVIETYGEIMKALEALRVQKHDFKTIILDSLDWMEGIVWAAVCRKYNKDNIEDFGFGRGYILVDEAWRYIIRQLDVLQKRGMNIIAISHAATITITAPDSDDYMSYGLKLHKRAAGIWTEWADEILFVNYTKRLVRQGSGESAKVKAKGDGDRIIYTASRPAHTAKSRYALPDEIMIGQDKSWKAFHEALNQASDGMYLGN